MLRRLDGDGIHASACDPGLLLRYEETTGKFHAPMRAKLPLVEQTRDTHGRPLGDINDEI